MISILPPSQASWRFCFTRSEIGLHRWSIWYHL